MLLVTAIILILFSTTQFANAPGNAQEASDPQFSRGNFPYEDAAMVLPANVEFVFIEAGIKTSIVVVRKTGFRLILKALRIGTKNHLLKNAVESFGGKLWRFGSKEIKFDRAGLKHILERHHPDYFDPNKARALNTLFPRGTTVDDVEGIIESVLKQNADLIRNETRQVYNMIGEVKGIKYFVGIENGRVGQCFPAAGRTVNP